MRAKEQKQASNQIYYKRLKEKRPEVYKRKQDRSREYYLDHREELSIRSKEEWAAKRAKRKQTHAKEYARYLELLKRPVPLRFLQDHDRKLYIRVQQRLRYYFNKLSPEQRATFDPYNPAGL